MNIKLRFVRGLGAVGFAIAAAFLAGCGGDGGGGNGGSGNAKAGDNPSASVANTIPVTVQNALNRPMVSVTVCEPGSTTNCQTIDNILLDTGSTGLRLVSSVASQVAGNLPVSTTNGEQLAECMPFGAGNTWGSVRTADVKMAGEIARNVPIQLIGDMDAMSVPLSCTSQGPMLNTAEKLGFNGILGVDVNPSDCGAHCADSTDYRVYFSCSNGADCSDTTVSIAQQVVNPVTRFATDNNGVILQMPSIPDLGQASVAGALTFGIETRANNRYSASQKLITTAEGRVYVNDDHIFMEGAAFDSGTPAYVFTDFSLRQCEGLYCPESSLAETVQLKDVHGTPGTVDMLIGNASQLDATGNVAFKNLAEFSYTEPMLIGMPFFYGRSVYYGFDQRASSGSEPYVAF
ncbi:DUF3443 domain-containing protein [Burkholderia ambifaria]|uniref:Lipoprotein n=1 Tax=Burkholderia ambifaria MEX-5 TaxID=396597 RepID=B1T1G4_9BURK|nr:DUF3443 domain-containing protein [Burkholderia ambifaria]EDT42597.1 conserved hypothetical protein [Burkholderia ambifaria MEX-5]